MRKYMKVATYTQCYRSEETIKDCLNSFKGLVDQQLVLISERPWRGEALPLDKTKKVAEKEGAEVIVGNWSEETPQRNLGLQILKDYDWIINIDSDERYDKDSAKKIIKFAKTNPPLSAYGITTMKTYWKTKEYVIDPPEGGGRLVLMKPSITIITTLCIKEKWGFLPKDIVMHHYSYVRSDEEMKTKMEYTATQEPIVEGWYDNVWLKWTPKMENLHPVNPETFKKAIKV
jgi:glycosyltransferase involved in cell wall biosynthesis